MLSVFGIVTLIHPAVFLLVLGSSLCSLGCFWLLAGRRLEARWLKLSLALAVFMGSFVILACVLSAKYGIAPISFEWIQGL